MINNIINQIKETEKKAKEIIVSSKKESAEIIEKTYEEAVKILKEAEKEVRVMFVEAEKRAKNDAAREAVKMEEDYNKRLEEIKNIYKPNQEKAIEKIIQRIVG